MRDRMPIVAGFIDQLRAAFGAENIDAAIRHGLHDGTFRAEEAGWIVDGATPRGRPSATPPSTPSRVAG